MPEMKERRPSVFIGSSSEGLEAAKAIQVNLDRACEVTIWSQGSFGLGGGTLEELVNQLNDYDFAVLVLTPDDVVISRDHSAAHPRDNVLLELGLFIGAIGRRRTFIVYDRNAGLQLPSDLAGVTPATYQPHNSGKMQAALGACCTLIEGAIKELGLRSQPKLTFDVDQNTHFQIIADLLDRSAHQFFLLMYDKAVALPRVRMFAPGYRYEYRFRSGMGGTGGFSANEMCEKLPDAGLLQQDLRNNVMLTDRGREFAKWLLDHGRRADFFECPYGTWGERFSFPGEGPDTMFPTYNTPPMVNKPHDHVAGVTGEASSPEVVTASTSRNRKRKRRVTS